MANAGTGLCVARAAALACGAVEAALRDVGLVARQDLAPGRRQEGGGEGGIKGAWQLGDIDNRRRNQRWKHRRYQPWNQRWNQLWNQWAETQKPWSRWRNQLSWGTRDDIDNPTVPSRRSPPVSEMAFSWPVKTWRRAGGARAASESHRTCYQRGHVGTGLCLRAVVLAGRVAHDVGRTVAHRYDAVLMAAAIAA